MNKTKISDQNNEKQLYSIIESLKKDPIIEDSHPPQYGDFFSDKLKISLLINSGLSYTLFEKLQNNTEFTKNEWADFLDLSIRTLDRYKNENKIFKAPQSEKIIALLEILNRGKNVFGDLDNFKLWLLIPNQALGRERPIDLLENSYGRELLNAELTHIEYGIFA